MSAVFELPLTTVEWELVDDPSIVWQIQNLSAVGPKGDDGPAGSGGGAAASVLLVVPRLDLGDDDAIQWVLRDLAADGDEELGVPAGFAQLLEFTMDDEWVDTGDVRVLAWVAGGDRWRYCRVQTDGTLVELEVPGGTLISVACLGAQGISEQASVWHARNDLGPFGSTSPNAPAERFEPIVVADGDVLLSGPFTGNLDGIATLRQALLILDGLTGGSVTAASVTFDDTVAELDEDDVQGAIEALAARPAGGESLWVEDADVLQPGSVPGAVSTAGAQLRLGGAPSDANHGIDFGLARTGIDGPDIHGLGGGTLSIGDANAVPDLREVVAGWDSGGLLSEGSRVLTTADRGQEDGVASLDGSGTVPDIQIPASIARDSEMPDPSDAEPEAPGASDPGTSADYSRADHVHAPPSAGQIGAATQGDIEAAIAALPILQADWGLHHYENDVYPISMVCPVDDLAGWEDGGGPEFWGVPTDIVSRLLIHNEIDRKLTGVYVYDPTGETSTIVRAADADTTAKLHGKLVVGVTRRERSAGGLAEDPEWRPIDSHIRAVDPTDDIDDAVWWIDELLGTTDFNAITGYLSSRLALPVLYNLVKVAAVDGSATTLEVIVPNVGASESGIPGPDDFTTIATLSVAFVVGFLGEIDVLVPTGSTMGVYTVRASGPWTSLNPRGGEIYEVLQGGATGETATWRAINDRGDTAIDPTSPPTSWAQFSLTPFEYRLRTDAAIAAHDADEEAHPSLLADLAADAITLTNHEGRIGSVESSIFSHESRIGALEAAPAKSRIIGGQNSGTAVTATTTPTSLLDSTITLPASGAGTLFEIEAMINLVQNSGGALAHTIGVYLGGTLLFSVVGPSLSSSATTRLIRFQGVIRLDSATLADGYGDCTYSANVQSGQGLDQTVAFGSTVALDLRGSMAAATATQTLQLRSLSVKRTTT